MPSGKGARERRREARLALQLEWQVRAAGFPCLLDDVLESRRIGFGREKRGGKALVHCDPAVWV